MHRNSDTETWTNDKNRRRCELVDRALSGTITDEERPELERLQEEMLVYRRTVAPLPIEDLRKLHQELNGVNTDGAMSEATYLKVISALFEACVSSRNRFAVDGESTDELDWAIAKAKAKIAGVDGLVAKGLCYDDAAPIPSDD